MDSSPTNPWYAEYDAGPLRPLVADRGEHGIGCTGIAFRLDSLERSDRNHPRLARTGGAMWSRIHSGLRSRQASRPMSSASALVAVRKTAAHPSRPATGTYTCRTRGRDKRVARTTDPATVPATDPATIAAG